MIGMIFNVEDLLGLFFIFGFEAGLLSGLAVVTPINVSSQEFSITIFHNIMIIAFRLFPLACSGSAITNYERILANAIFC